MPIKCPRCSHENPDNTNYCGKCSASLDSPGPAGEARTKTLEVRDLGLKTGTILAGRYEIIEPLGRGGMGKVYKAHDLEVNEDVALKVIRPEIADNPRIIQRFQNELKLARKISHRNVCRMFDLGRDGATQYITMEFIPGEDLKTTIRRIGPVTVRKAVDIGKQICQGLSEAHGLGIIHRDLKPSNIIIDTEGNVRIMDFGIALSRETEGITDPGTVPGTVEYLAPEQLSGKRPDASSDIYSLGVILYEMVTGRLPFRGDSTYGVAVEHLTGTPRDPMESNPDVPAALSRLILKCLARDPAKRFHQASEVCAELSRVEQQLPRHVGTSFLRRPREAIRSRPAVKWILAAGLTLAVVAAVYFIGRGGGSPPPPPPPANSLIVLPFRNLSLVGEEKELWPKALYQVIRSLNQSAGLRVVPYETCIQYKDTVLSDVEVAKKHGVTYILKGSMTRKDGNAVLEVELRRARPDEVLFSQAYPSPSEKDFMRALDDLVPTVALKLGVQIAPDRVKPLPTDPQARTFYDYGLRLQEDYFSSSRPAAFEPCISYFKKALAIEPRSAIILWQLGITYETRFNREKEAADEKLMLDYWQQAYEQDQGLAETNLGMGWLHFNREDHAKAFGFFKRAMELDSNSADVNFHVGAFLRSLGLYEQARKHYSRALVLNPVPGDFAVWHQVLADCDSQLGDVREAADLLRTAMGVSADAGVTLQYAVCLIQLGQFGPAAEAIALAQTRGAEPARIRRHQALLASAAGRREEALGLVKGESVTANQIVIDVQALLGLKDRALQGIQSTLGEKGFQKYRWYPYNYLALKNNPFFDGLRGDTEFTSILEKEKAVFEDRLRKFGAL